MSRLNLSHIYNPANQSPDELIENFVIRTKEFKKINDALNNTALNQSPQHFLIEGQRGTGKTSLLLRLQYAMADKDAPRYLLPVQLPEEQYNIFNLCRLWESVAEYLDDIPGFENTSEMLEEHREEHDYESICYDLIDTLLIKNKKRLVLLLDNFGEMLKRIGETDQKRLRDILHMSKHIQIVAASAKTLEQTYKYESPFFEFFKIIRLKGLDQSESIALLEKLATTYQSEETIQRIIKDEPQRIETIRRLSGGIPRTIILLFEILLDDTAQVFDDLESILDKVTPLYKHRMDDLPKQQQIIMDAIALNWDGISNREIANALKSRSMDGKKIAAQLRELEKTDLVKSRPVDKKNKIYFIAERFFNIWYLMRFGRKKNKEHVRWLVLFLQEWCSPDELKNRALSHIENLKNNSLHPQGGYLMAEAMALALPDADLGQQLLKSTKDYIGRVEGPQEQGLFENSDAGKDKTELANDDNQLSNQITELKQALERGESGAMFSLAELYRKEFEKFELAIEYYQMAVEKDDARAMNNLGVLYQTEYKDFDRAIEYYQMAVEKDHAGAMYNLGWLYKTEYKDFERAVEYYQMAVEQDDTRAMNNLGVLYETEYKDFDRAIEYYQMAVEKDHARAMYNLGLLYDTEYKDFDRAIEYYQMAVEKDHARAMNNLGLLYETEYKDFDRAIEYYQMAVEKDDAGAMYNLGELYETEYKDFDRAIEYYQMAVEKDDADAMVNLGWLYKTEYKDFERAIEYYQMAVEKDDTRAMVNLGRLYHTDYKDFERAIEYYQMAVEKDDADAMANLALLYQIEYKDFERAIEYYQKAVEQGHARAMVGLASLYEDEFKDFERAIECYQMAVEQDHADAMNGLAWLYYETVKEKGLALKLSRRAVEADASGEALHTYATVALWNQDFETSNEMITDYLSNHDYSIYIGDITDYFILLLAMDQNHTALNLFNEFENLKVEIKPIYFATMKLLRDEHPKEYLKMGEELEDTVDEVLKKVDEYRIKFAN